MADQSISLAGKVAVVTGGSNGIGAATVRSLAACGARVAIGYHNGEARASDLAASLPGDGHSVLRLILEETATLEEAAARIRADYGRCDALVNSAGFTRPVPHGDLAALDDTLWDAILTANVRGVFATIRAFAPLMKETGDAVIVNVSSTAGFTGTGSSIAYCAAKAAVDTMSLSLARVLAPQIRVMAVSPGAVATDFVAGRGRDQLEKLAAATPLKRITEPEDVARAIMACITHLTSSTGDRIVVDAGRHLV